MLSILRTEPVLRVHSALQLDNRATSIKLRVKHCAQQLNNGGHQYAFMYLAI